MYADVSKPPAPLPQPDLQDVRPGLKLLPPLLRKSRAGPGIIILVPNDTPSTQIKEGVPSLALKWAEEGYTVVEIQDSFFESEDLSPLKAAIGALEKCSDCASTDKVGLVGGCSISLLSRCFD